MIGSSACNIKKILVSLLLISALTASLFSQDRKVSGIINTYRHVVAIGPAGTLTATLNNVTVPGDTIAPGDTILLIQMKGAIIVGSESSDFGGLKDMWGLPVCMNL